jgi:ubiquitin carboxyl-terminal hydrolase 4/11
MELFYVAVSSIFLLVFPALRTFHSYGDPTLPLPRKVIAQGISNQLMIELHPLLLRVVRVVEQSTSDTGPSIPPVAVSVGATLIELSKALASPFNMNDTPHRIWTEVRPDTSTLYSLQQLIEDRAQLLKESEESVGKQMIESGDVFAIEFQENGNWLVDADKMGSGAMELFSSAIVPPPPLFSSGNDFFLTLQSNLAMGSQGSGSTNKKTPAAKITKTFGATSSSSRGDREPGTLGLGNM